MKRICKILTASLLLASMFLGLTTPVLAVNLGDSDKEALKNSSELTGSKLDPNAAFDKFISEGTKFVTSANTLLSSDTNADVGKIYENVGQFMIVYEWLSNNFYSETENGDGPYRSLLQLTKGAMHIENSGININTADAEALLNAFYQLLDDILAKDGLLKDEWNLDNGTGTTPDTGVLGGSMSLPGIDQILGSNADWDLVGNNTASTRLRAILTNYCDLKVLGVLTAKMDELAGGRSTHSYGGLKELADTTLQLDGDEDKARAVWKAYGQDIKSYLDIYNNIHNYANTWFNISLDKVTLDEKQYYGVQLPMDELDSSTSKTTYALWKIAYTTTSADSKPTVPDNITIDVTQGALNLMSNCTIQNGEVILDTLPELKNIGYAILAAGAIYDPFVSKAGNDDFINAVNNFLTDSDEKADFNKVLQTAINTKKPLYQTTSGKSSWKTQNQLSMIASADYKQASLADTLNITKGVTTAYVVIAGEMTPSAVDASTWDYCNRNRNIGAGVSNTEIVSKTAVDKGNNYNNNGTTDEQTGSLTLDDPNSAGTVSSTSDAPITVGTVSLSATSAQMSPPIMITAGRQEAFWSMDATGFAASVGGLTSLVIHNAAQDVRNNKYLQTPETTMLFLNGLGDIVFADNTVLLPAIANPLLYNYENFYQATSGDTYIDKFTKPTTDTVFAYYPYTAAFMNHYPSATMGPSEDSADAGQLSVKSESDKDKFLICVEDQAVYAKRIKSIGDSAELTARGGVKLADIFGGCFSIGANEEDAVSVLNIAMGKAGFNWQNFIGIPGVRSVTQRIMKRETITPTAEGNKPAGTLNKMTTLMITRASATNPEVGLPYFPLVNSDVDYDLAEGESLFQRVAGPVVTSAMRYISNPGEGTGILSNAGNFNVVHYIANFLGEGQLGTAYAETLEKNYQVSYEDLVADTGNRFLRFLVQICDSAIGNLGQIEGVLAIKGPYQNSFFTAIVNFVQNFYLLICVALMVIVAAKFFKGHFNMIYVCFMALCCVAGFEVYAKWLPTMLPSIYNFAVNDIIEDTVWATVSHQAEKYDETYKDSSRKDTISGDMKPYTATITLYTMTNAELSIMAGRTGVDIDDILKGTTVYLDYEAGIFVQGNEIRMSVDHLLFSNSMRGLYQSQWAQANQSLPIEPIDIGVNDNPYSIQLVNPYVSLEAYYTPFDHIERQFLKNLNTFANIFRIERNVINYNNGELYKDAFVFNAFVHSGIFTAPGNDDVLRYNIAASSVAGDAMYTEQDILDLCNTYFHLQNPNGTPASRGIDWLNLYDMFLQPDLGMQNSLWGYIMQRRGWYDDSWHLTEKGQEKVSDLIYYINTQTKMWLIENEKQMLYCSDENAIKLTALYATTAFTHYVSEFNQWLYPNYINAADIALQDVLYGSMTTLHDRNHAYDGTVTNTVALNLGIFGVLFLLIIVIVATVFIFIVTYMVPVLYAMFGIVLIFKLVNDDTGIGLVQGYVKVTLTSAVLYVIFSLSLKLVDVGGYEWYGYLGCALLMSICLYFLFWVVISIIQDAGEMGNNTLGKNLLKGLNGITLGAVKKMAASSVSLTSRVQNTHRYHVANRYGRGYGVDDYDRPFGQRRGYRYNEDVGRDFGYGYRGDTSDYSEYARNAEFSDEPTSRWRRRRTQFGGPNRTRW